jgi:hypothetical protein
VLSDFASYAPTKVLRGQLVHMPSNMGAYELYKLSLHVSDFWSLLQKRK